jgi:uncharacterized membrane protein
MELGRFMGYLHPVLIHFPLVLLITAIFLEGVAFFSRHARLSWAARLILLLGVVSTLFTFVCGNFAEIWAARSGISQDALEYHEFLATITSWLFVGLTAWRMLMSERTRRVWRGAWLAAAVGACVLLGLTGHHGAMLVYERAAAVQNVGLLRPPPHEDLAILMQRQSPESLFYSNMMHHLFGWMVLGLAALLLLDQIAPKAGEKARQIGPLLLFAGGLFLLVFSDQDAWPLYHVRPYRPVYDKEVLLHKTYAALMLLIGLRGLWLLLRGRRDVGTEGEGHGGPDRKSKIENRKSKIENPHDRLMAVFALIGGALLFTHVHSAAPYANVAVGVYIHHTALGLVALAIGAVKLLDDVLPERTRRRALAYPALMGLEALLLINYNEGLPWFLGYGRFSAVAAHGGLVAPLGPNRAELVYHPETARLELFVMRPDGGEPVPVPAREARAVVRVGDQATEVTLTADPGGAHFAGTANFLRGLPTFQVRAHVRTGRGREWIADFEPWVDRAQAAPHSTASWVCPMHPQTGSAAPGRCPLCGMALQPRRPPRPAGVLHDPDYRMDLALDPPQSAPGRPVRMTFTPRRTQDNRIVAELDVVHTKKLHLIIVSRDLAFFDHVHPTPQPDGALVLDYAFPHPGAYVLYADLTPAGAANQVFRLPVTVPGVPPAAVPLRETAAPARIFGDYRVGLTVSPWPPQPREEATLTFTIEEDGKPVTDLQPFLGAGGHCVILSQDTREYLHSHPLEPPGGPPATGPVVTFHTRFPRSGLYKAWGQFLHRGKVLTADFVFCVP